MHDRADKGNYRIESADRAQGASLPIANERMAAPDSDAVRETHAETPDVSLDFLRGFALLTPLSEQSLEALAEVLVAETFAPETTIVRQGDAGSHLHFVVDGELEVRVHDHGQASAVARLFAGDCFGDMSLLTGDPASADVVAVTAVRTLGLPRDEFEDLVGRHPGMLRELVGVISRRLATTGQHVAVSRNRRQALRKFFGEEHADRDRYHGFVGHRRTLAKVERVLKKYRDQRDPLHIEGERGTGKALIARILHFEGPLADGPLIRADGSRISEQQWGDRLFGALPDVDPDVAAAHGVAYMELAQGGTLVIQDVERLPTSVQYRLVRFLDGDSPLFAPSDVRVITTSHLTLEENGGKLVPELADRLADNHLPLIPLRDRKHDIPELVEHFIAKYAARLGKVVSRIDERALRKLVREEFRAGNVIELEEVIERAVTVAETSTIYPEHIFLASDAVGPGEGISLPVRPSIVERLIGLRTGARWVLGFGFVGALVICYAPNRFGGAAEGVTKLLWSVGWPLLILSFVAGARTWCGVCPMGSAARVAQRFVSLERRIPRWLVNNSPAIVMVGIVLIFWTEEVVNMRHSPVATAILFTTIASGSVLVGVVFQRAAWCRYVCPLGGIAGTCASTGLVEVRPTLDYCATRCKEHKCYTGTDTAPGCPMFNHVMFLDSTRYCTLCLNCVRACPNDSPRVSIRPPGQELWHGQGLSPETGRITMLLMGVMVGLSVLHRLERGTPWLEPAAFAAYRAALVTGVLVFAAVVPVLLVNRLSRGLESDRRVAFWRLVTAWLPLTAAGLVCYELGYLPFADDLTVALALGGEGSVALPAIAVVRVGALVVGFAVAIAVLARARRDAVSAGFRQPIWPSVTAMGAFCIGLLALSA